MIAAYAAPALTSEDLFELAILCDTLGEAEQVVGRKLNPTEARKLGEHYQTIEEAEALCAGPTAEQLAGLMARNPEAT